MHPAFIWYWKSRNCTGDAWSESVYGSCGRAPQFGGRGRHRHRRDRHDGELGLGGRSHEEDVLFGGGGLGVRRPLRYLSWKLDLSEEQVTAAARILEQLKIERAQAVVDLRRAAADLAEAVEENEFGRARAEAAREQRLGAAARVQEAVARTLEALHGVLEPDQRAELATLIRTGQVRF